MRMRDIVGRLQSVGDARRSRLFGSQGMRLVGAVLWPAGRLGDRSCFPIDPWHTVCGAQGVLLISGLKRQDAPRTALTADLPTLEVSAVDGDRPAISVAGATRSWCVKFAASLRIGCPTATSRGCGSGYDDCRNSTRATN
jgi:hypothetical protein